VTTQSQEGLRRELLVDLAALDRSFAALREVAPERLERSPAGGGWSAAQVLEHLCVAATSYLDRIETIVADPAARRADDLDRHAWRSTFGGGWLARAMEMERRMPAPAIYRPAGAPRPEVLAAFLDTQARLRAQLEAARDLDWRRVRFVSPVSALLRMNLGDAFLVLVRHAQRHRRQIERVLQQ
jgi:hypothetical protein